MKKIKFLTAVLFLLLITCNYSATFAQCAMCTLNADNSVQGGNTQGKGLNAGILYLLAAPYLAVAGVGFVWYKKYRRKNIPINMRDEKIHLN